MRLSVDERLCGTTGQCAHIAPQLFRIRPDGVGEVIATPTPADEDDAHDAIEACPVGAITLT